MSGRAVSVGGSDGADEMSGRWSVRHLSRQWPVLVSMFIASITFALAADLYPRVPLVSDALNYTQSAWGLVSHGFLGYGGNSPDAFVTPGYPLFLAAFYAFGREAATLGDAVRAIHPLVLAAQLVLAVGTVGLVAECGITLGGVFMGLTAGVLAAAYLPFAWGSSLALSETLGTLLMSILLLVALRLTDEDDSPGPTTFALFGVAAAAVALTRPAYVLWAVAPIAWLAVRRRTPLAGLARSCGIAALAFALVMAPWWVRNVVVLHQFVALADNGGEVRLAGAGGYPLTEREQQLHDQAIASGGDGAAAVANERLAAEWNASPKRFLVARLRPVLPATLYPYVAPEVYYYLEAAGLPEHASRIELGPRTTRAPPPLVRAERHVGRYHLVLILLAFLSLLFVGRWARILVAASVPFYSVLVHAPLLFFSRYFFPAMPAVIVLAAVAACGLLVLARRMVGHALGGRAVGS